MIKNIQNIYENLLELSDLNLQKEIWFNIENTKGLVSSYAELMNRLFDDDSGDFARGAQLISEFKVTLFRSRLTTLIN